MFCTLETEEETKNTPTLCHCTPVLGLSDTHSSVREADNATRCVRAHTDCPEYHWVFVRVCMRDPGCVDGLSGLTRPLLFSVQVSAMSTKVRDADVPLSLWLLLYIPIIWMCKPVHVVWKSSINVYQENGTKTKNVTF